MIDSPNELNCDTPLLLLNYSLIYGLGDEFVIDCERSRCDTLSRGPPLYIEKQVLPTKLELLDRQVCTRLDYGCGVDELGICRVGGLSFFIYCHTELMKR